MSLLSAPPREREGHRYRKWEESIVNAFSIEPLVDHYEDAANVGLVETDLYVDTIPARTLKIEGQKIHASYGGTLVAVAIGVKYVRLYLGSTLILEAQIPGLAGIGAWTLDANIVRTGSDSVRAIAFMNAAGNFSRGWAGHTEITGLTFEDELELRLTGQSLVSSNDIVAKFGAIEWKRQA